MIEGLIFALGGLVMLGFASDQFVKGAVRLAMLMHIAPVVVGSVIVGFGTSAPEMVVSGIAAANDNLDIGIGNVVGSNVANVSLVLGCATVLAAVPVQRSILLRELPISVCAVVLFAILVQGEFNRFEALVLLATLLAMIFVTLRSAQSSHNSNTGQRIDEFTGETSALIETFRTVAGLVVVAIAAWLVVFGAAQVAEELDLSGGFIGFTMVAIGTSAPELFTAIAAARRNEIELLIGNLLGSNMFNSLAVGGVIGLAGPGQPDHRDLTVWGSAMMVTVVVLSATIMLTKRRVARIEGFVLVLAWVTCVFVLRSL